MKPPQPAEAEVEEAEAEEAIEEAEAEEAVEEAIEEAEAEEAVEEALVEEAIEEALVEEAVEEAVDEAIEEALVEEVAAAEEAPVPAAAEAEDGEEAGPVAASPFDPPGDWYVVHTYAGYENKVKANLHSRIGSMQMEDKIFDVVIPMEDVMEIKGGKKQVVQRKVFPGYLLVKMIYDNDSWYVVRNTPGVTGFVSSGTGTKPTPLSRREVEKILAVKEETHEEADLPPRVGGRRRGADRRRPVRRLHRYHLGDQRRTVEAEGAGEHLRPGDARRAGVRPGREVVTARKK